MDTGRRSMPCAVRYRVLVHSCNGVLAESEYTITRLHHDTNSTPEALQRLPQGLQTELAPGEEAEEVPHGSAVAAGIGGISCVAD